MNQCGSQQNALLGRTAWSEPSRVWFPQSASKTLFESCKDQVRPSLSLAERKSDPVRVPQKVSQTPFEFSMEQVSSSLSPIRVIWPRSSPAKNMADPVWVPQRTWQTPFKSWKEQARLSSSLEKINEIKKIKSNLRKLLENCLHLAIITSSMTQ